MPAINEYKCSKCDLTLKAGWGYCFYVEDDKGNRIDCHHPAEQEDVKKVLGVRESLYDEVRTRTGFNSFCICLDCIHQFKADLGGFEKYWSPYELFLFGFKPVLREAKDKRECPECKSKNVKTELELVGETCPKCKEGVIEEIWTGAIS